MTTTAMTGKTYKATMRMSMFPSTRSYRYKGMPAWYQRRMGWFTEGNSVCVQATTTEWMPI